MTSLATQAAKQSWASDDLMDELRGMAAERVHSVRQDLSIRLTLISALNMRKYLSNRPYKPTSGTDAMPPAGGEGAVTHVPHPDGGTLCSPPQARSTGTKITEEGIYYYRDGVYKVIKSEYSGHWQARHLDPATGRFTYSPGMMGVLRAEHKMTSEDSIRFEELYGYPTCTDCGRSLENDLSRQRRVGPKCWVNNGHAEN
jgi:hypothetical protein